MNLRTGLIPSRIYSIKNWNFVPKWFTTLQTRNKTQIRECYLLRKVSSLEKMRRAIQEKERPAHIVFGCRALEKIRLGLTILKME